MDDGAVEFLVVRGVKLFGVGAYRVEADEEVARNLVAGRIVEGDDVRIIVMLEILAVHLENLLVRTEDVANIPCPFSVGCCHAANPVAHFGLVNRREGDVF